MQPFGYIYIIIDQRTNKVYIGKRERTDQFDIDNYYGSGKIIKGILKKQGQSFLKKIFLGFCYSKKELKNAEIECISFFRAFGSDNKNLDFIYGYNLTKGGDGAGHLKSKEERKRISKANKGKSKTKEHIAKLPQNNKGYKQSKKAKQSKSIASKKMWQNDEYRTKISLKRKKTWQNDEYRKTISLKAKNNKSRTGLKNSKEMNAKISKALKGRKFTPEHKQKLRVAALKHWDNQKEALNV